MIKFGLHGIEDVRKQYEADAAVLGMDALRKKYGLLWFYGRTSMMCPADSQFQSDAEYKEVQYQWLWNENGNAVFAFNLRKIPMDKRVVPTGPILILGYTFEVVVAHMLTPARPATGLITLKQKT